MTDDEPAVRTSSRTSSTALFLLALGVVAGAGAALLAAARQRTSPQAAGGLGDLRALELQLRDELPWAYETSVEVYRGSGEIAVHVHDHGGLPGLRAPLDGPVLDQVDWAEPGGARLRFHVRTLPGGNRSEVVVKLARGEREGSLSDLEAQVRSAMTALRNELERSR